MAAKEVGDEWALSKQHLEEEVPIGRFAWRKEVCSACSACACACACACLWRRRGYHTTGPADFETTNTAELRRVKAGQGKHLGSFGPTTFTRVIKTAASHFVNKSLKLWSFQNANPYAGFLMCCHFEKLNYIMSTGADKLRYD